MNCRIEYTTSYSQIELVHDNLYLYNTKLTGNRFDESVKAKKVDNAGALILRGDNDEFLGGIVWHWLDNTPEVFVDYMFVSDKLRGQGWGRKLFAEFEKQIKSEGAESAGVSTNSFQAPEFYLKIGYKIIKEVPSPQPLVPENIHYYYSKKL